MELNAVEKKSNLLIASLIIKSQILKETGTLTMATIVFENDFIFYNLVAEAVFCRCSIKQLFRNVPTKFLNFPMAELFLSEVASFLPKRNFTADIFWLNFLELFSTYIFQNNSRHLLL